MTTTLDGASLAAEIRADLDAAVDRLAAAGERPGLAAVHAGEDPAAARYVRLKQRDCQELGMRGEHRDLDPEASAEDIVETVDGLNDDPAVHGVLVQKDVPDHVDWLETVRRIDPAKDVDGVHPANVGRLVAGDPRFVPCTALGIERLLVHGGVDLDGVDVVVVNHSNIVGKPLANLLVQRLDTATDGQTPVTDGRSTGTVCHANTESLAAKTRRADVLVVAVGIPRFVDDSMVTEGTTVVDVGISRVADGDGSRQVGDVDIDAVAPLADVVTPNPGGVGSMTRAMLQFNTVRAAARRAEMSIGLDPVPPLPT